MTSKPTTPPKKQDILANYFYISLKITNYQETLKRAFTLLRRESEKLENAIRQFIICNTDFNRPLRRWNNKKEYMRQK
jgi:hypothetical protein